MYLPTISYNGIEGSLFWLTVLSIVEGYKYTESDGPLSGLIFFLWWNIMSGSTMRSSSAWLVASTYPHGENFQW